MAPSTLAISLILLSALLHAIVNAIVKNSDDGLLTRGCMNAMAFAVAAPLAFFVPLPSEALWKILILSMLIHGLYPFFLVAAYRHGDLSAVFPIARGTTPLVVVILAAIFIGETISLAKVACIAIICTGVVGFAFERNERVAVSPMRGVVLAVVTGCIIAAYTMIDAIGIRMAETKMIYIVWLLVLDGLFVSISVSLFRCEKLIPFLRNSWKESLIGGALGVISYGLALYALGLGNVSEIAALRETSMAFAALIGAFFLKEILSFKRIVASALVLVGAVALQLVG
jgi:drug/metabolite transporter (DMT)-like permease